MWKPNPLVYIAGILIYSKSQCLLCTGMMRRLCRKKRALVFSFVPSASHQVGEKKRRDLVSSSLCSVSHQVCGKKQRDSVSSSVPSASPQALPVRLTSPLWSPAMNVPRALGKGEKCMQKRREGTESSNEVQDITCMWEGAAKREGGERRM